MLSLIASLTPYSDFNQSPRNMYQCQMAKQTMGTPMQSIAHRPDNKIYRIQTPQTPITRTKRYACRRTGRGAGRRALAGPFWCALCGRCCAASWTDTLSRPHLPPLHA